MNEFKPMKFKRIATNGVDLADLGEWIVIDAPPMSVDQREKIAKATKEAIDEVMAFIPRHL